MHVIARVYVDGGNHNLAIIIFPAPDCAHNAIAISREDVGNINIRDFGTQ